MPLLMCGRMNFNLMKMMKKFFSELALLSAFVILFGCGKESSNYDNNLNDGTQIVEFTTTPMTRSVFGTPTGTSVPTLWTDHYSVAVSLNLSAFKKSGTPVVANGGATANFSIGIDDDKSGSYTFYAISPYDALTSNSVNSTYHSVGITIPASQEALENSVDEKAQILLAKSSTESAFPESVTLSFNHLTAYGKLSFSNLALPKGESVSQVELKGPEDWAGRYFLYLSGYESYSEGDIAVNSGSNIITIKTNKTSDIWFACAPVDFGGKQVEVTVTTDSGEKLSKTITIPSGKKFEAGKVSAFTVNMTGITPAEAVNYSLVTDISELTIGSEIIIADSNSDNAMSTTQNTNNRAGTSVTKTTDTSSGKPVISSPGSAVQLITIGNGEKGGTYSLSTGEDGYLYAASSSNNYLRTSKTLDANASWAISIANDGKATIKATGSNKRNSMRFNNPNFACYEPTSSTGNLVMIYKKAGTGSGAIAEKVPESLEISDATTVFGVGESFSFDGTVTLIYSDLSTKSLSESEYSVVSDDVDMSVAGTYTVIIKYNDDIKTSYSVNVSSSQPVYTATFEGDTEHRTSGSNSYTGSNSYPVSGVYWTFSFGDVVTTGSPLDGSANALLRIAKNTTNSPVAQAVNVLPGEKTVTKVTFLCNVPSGVSMTFQYSTDGISWTTVETVKDNTVNPTNGYSVAIPNVKTNKFELKFSWTVSTAPSSNKDVQLDNIIVYGK